MTDLNNGSNWQKVYSTSRVATPILGTNKFNPIPKLIVPVDFTSSFLIIGASSIKAKPTWNLAFYADALINVGGIGAVQINHFFVPLGASLHQVNGATDSYKLLLKIPPWYTAMDIEIWQSDETVDRDKELESFISETKVTLARIEQEINSTIVNSVAKYISN